MNQPTATEQRLLRVADYELIRPLGRANHGALHLARPPARLGLGADDVVVVKILDARPEGASLRRLTRELRAFASARSDDLVTVYEAGQDGERFFYVMEHQPLGTLAAPDRALSRADVIAAVGHAARAAHALHEVGLAHCDIRPDNIYVRDGGARLGELGLAQFIAPGQTMTGVGDERSIEYVDPQILLGGRPSRASDVWALGLTLHRALTGVSVLPDLPVAEPLRAFRRLLTSTPELSPALADREREVVERCLAPARERYLSAADLAAELDALRLVTDRTGAGLPDRG